MTMIREASLTVFLLVAALNGLGLAGGYLVGKLIRLNAAGGRTLAIEWGCRTPGWG